MPGKALDQRRVLAALRHRAEQYPSSDSSRSSRDHSAITDGRNLVSRLKLAKVTYPLHSAGSALTGGAPSSGRNGVTPPAAARFFR